MSYSSSQYSKNENLSSADVKNKILKYLYTNIVSDVKHEIIKNENDLDNIRNNDYLICPRFKGTRSWILFFTLEDKYYAVNFPKHSQKKKEALRIHAIEIGISKELYRGTIMEGIYFGVGNYKYLIIDEIYLLAGENQMLKPKDDRLNFLSRNIKKFIVVNECYQMYVSQFYYCNKKSLEDLYEKIKSDDKIQEITFYPKISNNKIYSYVILDSDVVDNIIKRKVFNMHKTNNPDVYQLSSHRKNKKIGIAYIPTLDLSKKCKQWYKDAKKTDLLVKCQLDLVKNKWIPMEILEEDVEPDDLDDTTETETEIESDSA